MTFLSRAWLIIAAVLAGCTAATAGDFYSCVFSGKSASYHRDEVPRMKSLGAECEPLTAQTSIICAVGSVQTVFSIEEARAVLETNSRAVCATPEILVTTHDVAAPNPSVVVASSSSVAVLTVNRPTFQIDDKLVVYFRLGSHRLSSPQFNKIRQFADRNGNGSHKITITGHTDSTGSNAYNHLLSLRRAGVARDALISLGVSMDNVLSVSALGEESLRYETRNGKAMVLNRAVELRAYH